MFGKIMSKKRKESSSRELSDIISLLIRCPADKSYLLAYQQSTDYYLPSTSLNYRTWGQACKDLAVKCTGEELQPDNLIRVTRIWQGDGKPLLINVIFEIIVSLDFKNKQKIPEFLTGTKEKLVWMKVHEILRLTQLEMLLSPELKLCFSKGMGDHDVKILKEAADITGNFVIEVNKSHVLAQKVHIPSESLITSIGFTESDIMILYQEYLKFCYPFILMNLRNFRKLCQKLRWPEQMIVPLFRMGDLSDRRALTFREVLYIICVVEPDLTFAGSAAEARCKLVFRYFDTDKDGKLNQVEFTNLVTAIKNAKPTGTGISMEKEIEKAYKDFGVAVGSDIHLKDFVLHVGLLKFRGTSLVVKAPTSVRIFIRNALAEEGDEDLKGDFASDALDYTLAWHTIKVGKTGVKEIKDVLSVDWLFAKPPTSLKKCTSERSLNTFNPNTLESLTLNNLKYYTFLLSQKDPAAQEFKKVMSSLPLQIERLSRSVSNIFASEPRLLKISSPVFVLGDLHGNFPDICCFERTFWNMGLHLSPASMLLLGDYVDRGIYGVEVVAYLFAQKVKNPNKVYLIRGNHELRDIQRNFTFYNECIKKFGPETGVNVWQEINKAFDHMPLAAVIDNKVFCCHGGIPAPWLCPTLEHINKIPCPLSNPEEGSALAWDILWNDPVREDHEDEDILDELKENDGFALNRRRGTAHIFDGSALNKFLARNRLSFLIRAHEVQQAGVQIHFNKKMFTVFSSSQYNGGNNDAACILAFNQKLRIYRLDTTDFHKLRPGNSSTM